MIILLRNGGYCYPLDKFNPTIKPPSTSTKPTHSGISKSSADRSSDRSFDNAEQLVENWCRSKGQSPVVYHYRSEAGELVGIVARWDRADGSKQILQASLQEHGKWAAKAMPSPKLLYRLPEILEATGPIYLVEGEKCVEALRSIGVYATTWPGGSANTSNVDLSNLAGRDVILLADNDKPGQKAMNEITDRLASLTPQPTIRRVELPDIPEKGDVVDWIESHGDAAEPETIKVNLERLATDADYLELPEQEKLLGWVPFPTEALPQPLREFVEQGSSAIGCDQTYLALPCLSILASVIGTSRCLESKPNWKVNPILWTMIVGESGSGKSPAFAMCLEPIEKQQRQAITELSEAEENYQQELLEYEKNLKHGRRNQIQLKHRHQNQQGPRQNASL